MSGIVKAVKGVVKAVGNVVSGVVKAVGNVISSVVDFVVSPFMGLFGMPDMPSDSAEAQRQQGVLVQQQGSNVNIPVVYGYRKIAGTVVFAETGSQNNRYLWVAYVFAEGAVEGIREMFIDDVQLDKQYIANLNAGNTVDITTGKFKNRVKLQMWGDAFKPTSTYTNQGLNSILNEAPSWKNSHTFNGLVTVFARYEWKEIKTQEDADNNPFGGNIPRLQISLLGRRVASLLNNNTENYDYEGIGYTERYSTNPAEILLDYLRNPRYGKGLSNSEIDWDSFKKAAVKCNQTVEYISGIQGPILTTNHVLDTAQTLMNNVKILLTNMRAYMPYVQGKYKLKIEDAGNATDILSGVATIVRTVNKDNIIGNITYTGIDRNAKYNQVVVKYVDPDNKFSVQEVVFPETETERLEYQQIDGGRENKAEITFPACTNYAIAKDMARLIFNKSRFQDTASFKMDSSAFELEPGDNIYIDANIIKFGTDPNAGAIPWRIVSIKLNQDYTFDIGCVRNPDFIYPHVRVGEIDIVLPPYVPKGAFIEYPGNPPLYPVGLVPPTNAVTDPGEADRPGNGGGVTDPTDPDDGGGVGDPGGPINENPPNNPPSDPQPVPELQDFVTIDEVKYVTIGNQVYADITVYQPSHPNYDGLHLYYKRNVSSETVWEFKEITDKPGEGGAIRFRLGPLITGFAYSVKTRVKYSTNNFSTYVNTSILNPVSTGTEDPTDFQQTVGSGWSLPTEPLNLRRDTIIRSIVGQTLLTGGSPRTPRAIQVSITQDIYNRPINGAIAGMNIYYKPVVNKYWNKVKYAFDATYQEGTAYTFELPFGLGSPGTYQLYDFCFRWRYNDGTESELQYRVTEVRVETDPFANNNFDPFYGRRPFKSGQENVSDFQLITVDNAPPGSVADPRDIKLSFQSILQSFSVEEIKFRLNFPTTQDAVSLLGVRVYYKEVLATPTSIQSVDYTPLPDDVVSPYFELAINYDTMYEYVIVPLVDFNGATTEANNAWYFAGYVHDRQIDDDYPFNGNWYQQFIKEQSDFATAYAKFGTATELGPVLTTRFDDPLQIAEVSASDPREIDITIKQQAETLGNGRLAGVKIYYKPSTFDYWFSTTHTFSGYTEGSPYTFRFNGDLGSREGTVTYRSANYDFIFRWVYDNGEEGIYQARAMEVQVQNQSSVYELNIGSLLQEDVNSYAFDTVENAPPGAVPDARDLTISFNREFLIQQYREQAARFYIYDPVDPLKKFAGVRIYLRKVVPGSNPSFTITDFFPVTRNIYRQLTFKFPVEYDVSYEYVIVPVVSYNRTKTECNSAWYGRGLIHNRSVDGRDPDFFELLNFELVDTDIALTRIKTEFDQVEPEVQVTKWVWKGTGGSANNTNSFYELEFYHQHISNYIDCKIYRRENNRYLTGLTGYPRYYGLGPWEELHITDTNTSPNGVVTVKLRQPLSAQNFNKNISTGFPGGTLRNPLYNPNWLINLIPLPFLEFLIVVNTSDGVSPVATKLLAPDYGLRTGEFEQDIKQSVGLPQTVTVADYNNYDPNWLRNISEAIAPPLASDLKTRLDRTVGFTPPPGVI